MCLSASHTISFTVGSATTRVRVGWSTTVSKHERILARWSVILSFKDRVRISHIISLLLLYLDLPAAVSAKVLQHAAALSPTLSHTNASANFEFETDNNLNDRHLNANLTSNAPSAAPTDETVLCPVECLLAGEDLFRDVCDDACGEHCKDMKFFKNHDLSPRADSILMHLVIEGTLLVLSWITWAISTYCKERKKNGAAATPNAAAPAAPPTPTTSLPTATTGTSAVAATPSLAVTNGPPVANTPATVAAPVTNAAAPTTAPLVATAPPSGAAGATVPPSPALLPSPVGPQTTVPLPSSASTACAAAAPAAPPVGPQTTVPVPSPNSTVCVQECLNVIIAYSGVNIQCESCMNDRAICITIGNDTAPAPSPTFNRAECITKCFNIVRKYGLAVKYEPGRGGVAMRIVIAETSLLTSSTAPP